MVSSKLTSNSSISCQNTCFDCIRVKIKRTWSAYLSSIYPLHFKETYWILFQYTALHSQQMCLETDQVSVKPCFFQPNTLSEEYVRRTGEQLMDGFVKKRLHSHFSCFYTCCTHFHRKLVFCISKSICLTKEEELKTLKRGNGELVLPCEK